MNTGGVIYLSHITALVHNVRRPKQAVIDLEAAGLWERFDGGWEVHDYAQFQPTSPEKREQARRAGVRSAEVRAQRSVQRNSTGVKKRSNGKSTTPEDVVMDSLNGIEPRATGIPVPVPVPVVLTPSRPPNQTPGMTDLLLFWNDLTGRPHTAKDVESASAIEIMCPKVASAKVRGYIRDVADKHKAAGKAVPSLAYCLPGLADLASRTTDEGSRTPRLGDILAAGGRA